VSLFDWKNERKLAVDNFRIITPIFIKLKGLGALFNRPLLQFPLVRVKNLPIPFVLGTHKCIAYHH
jgi:hypothetical protein